MNLQQKTCFSNRVLGGAIVRASRASKAMADSCETISVKRADSHEARDPCREQRTFVKRVWRAGSLGETIRAKRLHAKCSDSRLRNENRTIDALVWFTINTKIFAIQQKILRGINFVKTTKIFSSVDRESGHSCLVFVQYPHRNEFPQKLQKKYKKSGRVINL